MCVKAGVKLACKPVFTHIFTSDGHPMLLEWHLSAIQEESRPEPAINSKKGRYKKWQERK